MRQEAGGRRQKERGRRKEPQEGRSQKKYFYKYEMLPETREIIGVYIGARSEEGAKQLWNSLPPVYRQCAVCYTDFWAAYACIFPSLRHQPVGKDSGKTNHIERFNNTLRQRVSRIVRKTLSFSKKLENHIGAIGYFIHHYNYVLSQ
ncbi:IS1 family transposase [Microcoleus sp. T2B6]